MTICLLTFSGVFCFNEISQIRCSDLQFSETDVKVRVQPANIEMKFWTKSSAYPVVMLERYMSIASLTPAVENWLFRPSQWHSMAIDFSRWGRWHTQEFVRWWGKRCVGLERIPDPYGLHSLRARGATAAANAGVEHRLFKRHGRWRSENAKDDYVKESYQNRLSVSLNLGL